MPKMVVLTDSETAVGFRLAGVDVREVGQEGAKDALDELIAADAYGLVVVDEGLIPDPIAASERAMRGRELPVVLPLPSLGQAFGEEDDAIAYMKSLVRNAIGFDIKLE
ncbi:MAG TPA: V-type ATP synthase subunit F [Trueperaceae bacterium]|nr:V-type ATP synthase subunit F [Trueperaceae bacterium]